MNIEYAGELYKIEVLGKYKELLLSDFFTFLLKGVTLYKVDRGWA